MLLAVRIDENACEFGVIGTHIPDPIEPPPTRCRLGTIAGNKVDQDMASRSCLAEGEGIVKKSDEMWRRGRFIERSTPGDIARIGG